MGKKNKKKQSMRFVTTIPDAPNRLDHKAISTELRGTPGKWGKITEGKSNVVHSQRAHLLGRGTPGRDRHYGDGFTFAVRSKGYGTGEATLYGRYDPPADA